MNTRVPSRRLSHRCPRILATSILTLLAIPAFAVIDTWDGGGADNNISTNNNWLDNTAPASDLVNTDLFFGGFVRPTPNLLIPFSANSLAVNNTIGANAFTFSGSTLTIGTGGIVNNDADTAAFTNPVTLGTPATTFGAVGGLTFIAIVNTGTSALTLSGTGPLSFINFGGTGSVNKTGGGTMSYAPNSAQNINLTVGAGAVNVLADGSANTFAGSNIAVNGTSTLALGESTTLQAATLTRASGATLSIASVRRRGSTPTSPLPGSVRRSLVREPSPSARRPTAQRRCIWQVLAPSPRTASPRSTPPDYSI